MVSGTYYTEDGYVELPAGRYFWSAVTAPGEPVVATLRLEDADGGETAIAPTMPYGGTGRVLPVVSSEGAVTTFGAGGSLETAGILFVGLVVGGSGPYSGQYELCAFAGAVDAGAYQPGCPGSFYRSPHIAVDPEGTTRASSFLLFDNAPGTWSLGGNLSSLDPSAFSIVAGWLPMTPPQRPTTTPAACKSLQGGKRARCAKRIRRCRRYEGRRRHRCLRRARMAAGSRPADY